MPLRHLIVLIINAHPARRGARLPSRIQPSERTPNGRMIDSDQADIDVCPDLEIERRHLHDSDRLLQAWNFRKTSLLRDRSNGDAVRRQPTNPHGPQPRRPASPRTGNCDGALTCAHGEIVHRSGLSSGAGLERSPLHDVRQHAPERTPRANPPGRRFDANRCTFWTSRIAADAAIRKQAARNGRGRHKRGYFERDIYDNPIERPPVWWSQTGSNRRPPACKAGALPTELWPLRRPRIGPSITSIR
jgi:hypothetical protein